MKKISILLLLSILAFSMSSCEKIKTHILTIQADAAYNQGNADKAIKLYRQIIINDPKNANAHWYLGLSYFSKSNKFGALRQVSELRKLGKDDLADELDKLIEERLPFQY